MSKRPWIVFFSRTGKEIVDIVDAIGREPDLIVTNAPTDRIHAGIFAMRSPIQRCTSKPLAAEYRQALLNTSSNKAPLATLHGWLRIVPAEICDEYEIYNGHPALISEYPELKGLDMQEAIIGEQTKYPRIGSVVHRVTPILDDGEIITSASIVNTVHTEVEAYSNLRETSLSAWLDFFRNTRIGKELI